MLILTRRVGEAIRIGDSMRLTLVRENDSLAWDMELFLGPQRANVRLSQDAVTQMFGVRILRRSGDREARVGINLPTNISVHREEVWQRIQQNGVAA